MAMTTPGGQDESLGPLGDDTSFLEFVRRVRAGDEWAAVELVRRYEPALRMEIRLRLGDPRLRRLLEPADLCQSVLKSFFVRATLGQYELDSPEKLLALLLTMARNKVAEQARRQRAQRRDVRREVSLHEDLPPIASAAPSPSRIAIGREMLEAFRERLTHQERLLADLRSQGCDWVQIARELGGTPQALRKRLSRAADRVARELGLDENPKEGEASHGPD
jgi:RNA polymerase sigma factor (sigma-70 family)